MKRAPIFLVPLLLVACASDEHQDLKQWMKNEEQKMVRRVDPLPEIKPFPVVSYEAADLLDPFKPAKVVPEKNGTATGGGVKPDLDRPREPLEAYPLESLKVVGMLQQNKLTYALVWADKVLHQVKIGNYIGQNFGMVTDVKMHPDGGGEVSVRELVQDPAGDWVERTSTLLLQQ